MDANTSQIVDRLERIEDKVDNLRIEVALLKRESDTRRINNYIRYAVSVVLGAIGGWLGIHFSPIPK
jgi:hypothetical protein